MTLEGQCLKVYDFYNNNYNYKRKTPHVGVLLVNYWSV